MRQVGTSTDQTWLINVSSLSSTDQELIQNLLFKVVFGSTTKITSKLVIMTGWFYKKVKTKDKLKKKLTFFLFSELFNFEV